MLVACVKLLNIEQGKHHALSHPEGAPSAGVRHGWEAHCAPAVDTEDISNVSIRVKHASPRDLCVLSPPVMLSTIVLVSFWSRSTPYARVSANYY